MVLQIGGLGDRGATNRLRLQLKSDSTETWQCPFLEIDTCLNQKIKIIFLLKICASLNKLLSDNYSISLMSTIGDKYKSTIINKSPINDLTNFINMFRFI